MGLGIIALVLAEDVKEGVNRHVLYLLYIFLQVKAEFKNALIDACICIHQL